RIPHFQRDRHGRAPLRSQRRSSFSLHFLAAEAPPEAGGGFLRSSGFSSPFPYTRHTLLLSFFARGKSSLLEINLPVASDTPWFSRRDRSAPFDRFRVRSADGANRASPKHQPRVSAKSTSSFEGEDPLEAPGQPRKQGLAPPFARTPQTKERDEMET